MVCTCSVLEVANAYFGKQSKTWMTEVHMGNCVANLIHYLFLCFNNGNNIAAMSMSQPSDDITMTTLAPFFMPPTLKMHAACLFSQDWSIPLG